MSQDDLDADLIRVTHYINPHNFWFKNEHAYLYNAEEQKFQQELITFCETNFGRGNITSAIYKPSQIGELVAVFYFQLGRWTRAVVDDIQVELGGQVMCNLWAIDEGVPIKTSVRYIKPLPAKFARMPSNVKHGGLECILPAETSYNYLEGRNVHKLEENWASGVATAFQNFIDDALSIKFRISRHYKKDSVDIYFGSMLITSHKNVTNSAISLLQKVAGKMVMVVDENEFYSKFPLLRTLNMRRSENNEYRENMKFHTNTFRTEYSPMTGSFDSETLRFQDKFLIEQAREKVMEWNKRNTAPSMVGYNEPKIPECSIAPLLTNEVQERKSQSHEPAYKELVDEESDEEHNVAMQQREKPNVRNSNYSPRKPQGNIYEKSVADVTSALQKIKLRRGEMNQRNGTDAPGHVNSTSMNIIPAGFSLGNIEFSNGSVILRTTEPNANRRINQYNPKSNNPTGNGRSPSQQRYNKDSRFDDRVVHNEHSKATYKKNTDAVNNDDADEQW